MLQKFAPEELTLPGKILLNIPLLFKYVERKHKKIHNFTEKGYQIRILHPVAWIIFPFTLMSFVAFYLYDGWIKELYNTFREFLDLYTII